MARSKKKASPPPADVSNTVHQHPHRGKADESPDSQRSDEGYVVIGEENTMPPEATSDRSPTPGAPDEPVLVQSPPGSSVAEVSMDADELKEEGNALYKAGEYARAIERYSAALEFAETDKLRIAIFGNRSMCHMQLEEYEAQLRCVLAQHQSRPYQTLLNPTTHPATGSSVAGLAHDKTLTCFSWWPTATAKRLLRWTLYM